MKALILLTFLFPYYLAAEVSCTQAIDDAKLLCESAQNSCADLKECLIRRDTCVDGVPKNQSDCDALNNCMQSYADQFPGSSRCTYEWYVSDSGSKNCFPKKHFLLSQEACPGRVRGVLNIMAYGLNTSVDSDYNCAAVLGQRNKKVSSCEERLRIVTQKCGSLPERYAYLNQYACAEAQRFSNYSPGYWSIDANQAGRVYNSSRRAFEEPVNTEGSSRQGSNSSSR